MVSSTNMFPGNLITIAGQKIRLRWVMLGCWFQYNGEESSKNTSLTHCIYFSFQLYNCILSLLIFKLFNIMFSFLHYFSSATYVNFKESYSPTDDNSNHVRLLFVTLVQGYIMHISMGTHSILDGT